MAEIEAIRLIKRADDQRAVSILETGNGQFCFEHLKWNEPLIEGCVVFDEGG